VLFRSLFYFRSIAAILPEIEKASRRTPLRWLAVRQLLAGSSLVLAGHYVMALRNLFDHVEVLIDHL
jgi:hypothetical protein